MRVVANYLLHTERKMSSSRCLDIDIPFKNIFSRKFKIQIDILEGNSKKKLFIFHQIQKKYISL